ADRGIRGAASTPVPAREEPGGAPLSLAPASRRPHDRQLLERPHRGALLRAARGQRGRAPAWAVARSQRDRRRAFARGDPARHRGGPGPGLSCACPRRAQYLGRRPRRRPRDRGPRRRPPRRAAGAEAVPRMTESAPPRLPRMSAPAARAAVAAMVIVYLALGVFSSRSLITWDDESSFLALG